MRRLISELRTSRGSDEVCAIHETPPGTVPSLERRFARMRPSSGTPSTIRFEASRARRYAVRLSSFRSSRGRAGAYGCGRSATPTVPLPGDDHGGARCISGHRRQSESFRTSSGRPRMTERRSGSSLNGVTRTTSTNLLSEEVVLSYSELAIDTMNVSGSAARISSRSGTPRPAGDQADQSAPAAFNRQQIPASPSSISGGRPSPPPRPMLGRLLSEDIEVTVLSSQSVGRVWQILGRSSKS